MKIERAIEILELWKDRREVSDFGEAIRTLLSLAESLKDIQVEFPKKKNTFCTINHERCKECDGKAEQAIGHNEALSLCTRITLKREQNKQAIFDSEFELQEDVIEELKEREANSQLYIRTTESHYQMAMDREKALQARIKELEKALDEETKKRRPIY